MFKNAESFNQPLNNWNVSNVTDVERMFWGARSFNQPLNKWNVSNVTNMVGMFNWALNDNLPEKHYVVDQELTLYAFGDILKKPPKYETADHTTNEKDITVVICNYARPGNIVEIIKEISPMYGLTVRGTQTLVSFAPLAFKAVLRRSSERCSSPLVLSARLKTFLSLPAFR